MALISVEFWIAALRKGLLFCLTGLIKEFVALDLGIDPLPAVDEFLFIKE